MDSIILYGKLVGFLVICCHTSLSWERKVWKMAKSNYTDSSLMLLPCVFFRSSPLKAEKKSVTHSYISQRRGVQTCWCSVALLVVLIAISLTRQVYFSPLWTLALGKIPGQFYSSLRWSSRSWSKRVMKTLFAPKWQVHQHLLVKVSKERHWCLCSPCSPLGLLTVRWLILSFLMSVNSAMPDKESVSSWCWRAHLSFHSSLWHTPNLEPEVVFHFIQEGMCTPSPQFS